MSATANRSWLRQAASDENGLADAAYVSILGIAALLIFTVAFICTMSAVSYSRCIQLDATKEHGVLTAPCVFEPQPLALGIAAAIGAFAAPIGALAGYMAATRRQPPKVVTPDPIPGTVTVAGPTGVTTVTATAPPQPIVPAPYVPAVAAVVPSRKKRNKRRKKK